MPGGAYYLSRGYRRAELSLRIGYYICMTPLAGAFGGLLASALLSPDSVGSLKQGRMIFVIEGIVTACHDEDSDGIHPHSNDRLPRRFACHMDYAPRDGPMYQIGNGLNLAASASITIVATVFLFWMKWDNRRRDMVSQEEKEAMLESLSPEQIRDLEWQHRDWRWKL